MENRKEFFEELGEFLETFNNENYHEFIEFLKTLNYEKKNLTLCALMENDNWTGLFYRNNVDFPSSKLIHFEHDDVELLENILKLFD